MAEVASKNERIANFEKMSSIRNQVDEMLMDGLINQYDVEEKVAELANSSEYKPCFSGKMFQKTADEPSSGNVKRGMFDSVLEPEF